MPIKISVSEGGGGGLFKGGGLEVPILFLWARWFFSLCEHRGQLFPRKKKTKQGIHKKNKEGKISVSCRALFTGQRISTNFFLHKVFRGPFGSWTPRGKSWTSAPKSLFSCGPGDGDKLLNAQAFGCEGLDVRGRIQPKKFKFMLFFLPWEEWNFFFGIKHRTATFIRVMARFVANILLGGLQESHRTWPENKNTGLQATHARKT